MRFSQTALLYLSLYPSGAAAFSFALPCPNPHRVWAPNSSSKNLASFAPPSPRKAAALSASDREQDLSAEGSSKSSDASKPRSKDATRRSILLRSATLPLVSNPKSPANAVQIDDSGVESSTPLADVPMIRLRLPQAGVGREYVVIQMKVKGQGPFDFMVDSGLTTELITPHLQQVLGIAEGRTKITGLAAGGDTAGGSLVELSEVSLCCGKFSTPGITEFPLPPLHAVVSDFPQEHIDSSHDPVEGMLGMEALALFDMDFDYPAGRLRFWKPGTAAAGAKMNGLVEIPAAVLNETLLIGIRVTSAKNPKDAQPIVGILDCGATFSAVNWAGAELLGLPPKEDRAAYLSCPTIMGVGVDGRPQYLPMKNISFTFRGDIQNGSSKNPTFAQPPRSWRSWEPVQVGIGDLPVFSELLGDGIRPYQGPAALIGLDVLSQRRVIMEAGRADSRRRRLFVSPS